MKIVFQLGLVTALALAGCGQNEPTHGSILRDSGSTQAEPQNKFGFAEARAGSSFPRWSMSARQPSTVQKVTTVDMATRDVRQSSGPDMARGNTIPISLPKIAYVYAYGYRLEGKDIANLQREHADYCESQGPQVCRIVELRQSGMEGEYASGDLRLQVVSPRARAFGAFLTKIASGAGGKEVESAISGEDLSKKIVDTQARLRTRETLRDRLMEVLATRKGTVSELLEAERGVAQVNEEIDQAKSWLAEMQGRVEFSEVRIRYVSKETTFEPQQQSSSFMTPIAAAVGNIGVILGSILAILIVILSIIVPLGLIGWVIRTIWLGVKGHLPPSLIHAYPRKADGPSVKVDPGEEASP